MKDSRSKVYAELLVRTLADEAGNRQLTTDDVSTLQVSVSAKILKQLFDKSLTLNRIGDEGIEAAKKILSRRPNLRFWLVIARSLGLSITEAQAKIRVSSPCGVRLMKSNLGERNGPTSEQLSSSAPWSLHTLAAHQRMSFAAPLLFKTMI